MDMKCSATQTKGHTMSTKYFRDESIFQGWVECETPDGRMRFERTNLNMWRAYVRTETDTLPGYLLARSFRCERPRPRPRTLFNLYASNAA